MPQFVLASKGALWPLTPRRPQKASGNRFSSRKSRSFPPPSLRTIGRRCQTSATLRKSVLTPKRKRSRMEQELFPFMAGLTSSPAEPPAKISPSQENAGGVHAEAEPEAACAGNGCDWLPNWVRALSFGKTRRGAFPRTTEETSRSLWPHLLSSGMAAHGEFWTRSIPEWTNGPWQSRNDAGVSGLSAWLMPTSMVPPKYFLSRKACLGILARSERRGRPLPPALEAALRRQADALATTTN